MGRQQIFRGNPEDKLVLTNENFSRGVDLMGADDTTSDSSFRYLKNIDLGEMGSLTTRKGFGPVSAINEVFDKINDTIRLANYPKELFIPNLSEDKPNLVEVNEDGSIDIFRMPNPDPTAPTKPQLVDVTHSSIHAVSQIIEEGIFEGEITSGSIRKGESMAFGMGRIPTDPNPIYVKVLLVEKTVVNGGTPTYRAVSNTHLITDFSPESHEGVLVPLETISISSRTIEGDSIVVVPSIIVVVGYGEYNIKDFRLEIGTRVTSNQSNIKQMILFKLVNNEYNIWERLVKAPNVHEVVSLIPSGQTHGLDMLFVYEEKNGDLMARRVGVDFTNRSYEVKNVASRTWSKPIGFKAGGLVKALGEGYYNLMNVPHGVQGSEIYFTSNDYGMLSIGSPEEDIRYIGNFPGKTNTAYKPTPLEVRKIGFNVLGTDPLTWIDRSGLATKSIQGIYIMTQTGIPVDVIPAGQKFRLAIMYTGATEPAWGVKFASNLLSETADEQEISHTKTKIESLSVLGALTVYDIQLTTQVTSQVYITITMTGEDQITPYRDIYDIGEVAQTAKPVASLNLGDYSIVRMGNRSVYYAKDTIWFSEFDMFDYVPNLNYVILPIHQSDEIVAIKFFRSSYIIFTREKIYKLRGYFGSDDFGLSVVSDTMGCIAPNSIAMVNNLMYFLSATGLHALKSETFREDMEHIKRIDQRVNPLVVNNSQAFGYVEGNQYVLNLNHNFARDLIPGYHTHTTIESRSYLIPDAIRHYYEYDAYSFDVYAEGKYAKFLFQVSGETFAFLNRKVYNRKEGTLDFGSPFPVEIETIANNMGYPNHEKKLKEFVIKLGQTAFAQNFDIEVYADGYKVHTDNIFESHELRYADIESSRNDVYQLKFNSIKCKNIALNIKTDSTNPMSVRALSYVYKLGKMRK